MYLFCPRFSWQRDQQAICEYGLLIRKFAFATIKTTKTPKRHKLTQQNRTSHRKRSFFQLLNLQIQANLKQL